MKNKKLIAVILLNIFIVITYPAIHSVSNAQSGASSLNGIVESTALFLILFNILLLLYILLVSFFKKKSNTKVLLTGTKIIAGTLLAVYTVVVLFVLLSSPFDVLSLYFKLENPKAEIRSVCQEDLGNNRYLEVIENDGIYECYVVRKKIFAFCHDNHGQNYYWDNSKINTRTLGLTDTIPKFFKYDADAIIIYSALSDDIDKAYIDGNEMSVVTDGTIRLAYYVIEGKSIDSSVRYFLTKENKKGEEVFLIKM